MNETPKNKSGWRILRRVLIGAAILATLIAIFYTEEDWRGKRAWETCKADLEAKGAVLDWDRFIPPSVPDDLNIFKVPKMQEWFVGRGPTELSKQLQSTNGNLTASVGSATNLITSPSGAAEYLAWSDQFEPDFDLIRAALKRPYAWMDGDYSEPFGMLIPNFVTARACAQMLAQRAHCYLLLGQPEKALNELTLLNDSRRLEEREPTGKPMTLVEAMINVAITGLYVNTIADGFRLHAWQEPQLAALQEQLARIDLPPLVAQSFKCESAAVCRAFETTMVRKIISMANTPSGGRSFWQTIKDWRIHVFDLVPRGWVYQNMATVARLDTRQLDGFDSENGTILPGKVGELRDELDQMTRHPSPYTYIAVIGVPNTAKAMQTLAYNQTLANEAQIVCALERYHLAQGEYPETLDALVPQFIEKLPRDIIGGKPLHYRRTNDGKFLLYSVGWNETDDGGQVVLKNDGSVDREKGDWVWQYPAK
jgi:hypothetical protein